MVIIISAILTVLFAGLSTGGLLVTRRYDPHQSLFIIVGLTFFLFFYIGNFIGNKIISVVGHSTLSILFGVFCLAFIGFLVWRYDPSFGYVKQEPSSIGVFVLFFLLIGLELAIIELSIWFAIIFTFIFIAGMFLGFFVIYQLIHRHRSPQILALLPLFPLLFIGLFKLI